MKEPTRLFDFPHYQLATQPLEKSLVSNFEGKWQSISTQEFVDQINLISKGLLEMGVKPGDKIGLISHNNRMEWNIMDHGILQIGAIDVPIYPTMSERDYEYIFNHAELTYCFVSNEELFEKVQNIRDKVPSLQGVYTFEHVKGADRWVKVMEKGKEGNQDEVEKIKDSIKEDDLATLIYTSGTTGTPKGVMLTHKNIASNATCSVKRLPLMEEGEGRTLSFLPVCHIYERMLHYLYMYNCSTIYFAESLETIKEDLNRSQPHIFTAVPRLLEKFYDGIVAKGSENKGVKKALFMWAVNLALKWEPDRQNGGWYEFKLGIARKLIFSKVKAALGLTNIKAVASGSAALQPRLARFFNGAGIPVYEGYGLTETSPVIAVNTEREPGMLRIGTVGKPIDKVEVKIADDGEILCKGPNVMIGYYKNPEKTAEVLKDGWFHTGDIGELSDDGFLKITDRKKEIFKTSGGKYIAPQLLENKMKESLFIEQVMVVGEAQKFPAAIIIPSFEALKTWCKQHDMEYPGDEEVCNNQRIKDRIWKDVEKANKTFGRWEQVKVIELVCDPFTIENGMLTPTLKLKRKPILEKYEELINSIYNS